MEIIIVCNIIMVMTITVWIFFVISNGKIIKADGLRIPFIIYVLHCCLWPYQFFCLIIWIAQVQKYFLEVNNFVYTSSAASIFIIMSGILPASFVFQRIQFYKETGLMHDKCAHFGAFFFIEWFLKISILTAVPLAAFMLFLDSDQLVTFLSIRWLVTAFFLSICDVLNLYFIWTFRNANEQLQFSSRNLSIEININLKLVSSIHITSFLAAMTRIVLFHIFPGQVWVALLEAVDTLMNNMLMFFVLYNNEAEKAMEDDLDEPSEEKICWVEIPGFRPIKIRESAMITENLCRYELDITEVEARVKKYRYNRLRREYEANMPEGELEFCTVEQVNQRMRELLME